MKFITLHSQFQIPHFLFLRKCVAIREQLQLMGFPNSKLQIRNIPVGSENYYACFTECCYASGYKVQKNEKGEVTDVIPFSKLKMEEEFEEDEEESEEEDDSDDDLFGLDVYSIAEPSNVELYVYEDERTDFRETAEYILKKIQAEQATAEITNDSNQIFIDKKQIELWLKKHKSFYLSLQMDWNIAAFKSFQTLYFWFQHFADDFKHMNKAQQAVDEYIPFDEYWLYKYDRLYFCALMGWESGYEVFHDDPFVLKQESTNLHLIGEEFRSLIEFPKLFVLEYDRERK
jgi:hypothetical protein